jgi:hypothetical protein
MANWVLKGLRTGVKSTAYPARAETAAGVSPGRPAGARLKLRRCGGRPRGSLPDGRHHPSGQQQGRDRSRPLRALLALSDRLRRFRSGVGRGL